jgi:Ni,Fe-hydrogenase III large subunit
MSVYTVRELRSRLKEALDKALEGPIIIKRGKELFVLSRQKADKKTEPARPPKIPGGGVTTWRYADNLCKHGYSKEARLCKHGCK